MTDLGLINCLKGIWSLSIHKKVFHKSTIHLFPTKIHIFFQETKKKLTQIQQIQQKNQRVLLGKLVCFGSVMGPLGSVMGLMGAKHLFNPLNPISTLKNK